MNTPRPHKSEVKRAAAEEARAWGWGCVIAALLFVVTAWFGG